MVSPNDSNFIGPRPGGGPPQVGADIPFNEIIQNLQTEENEIKEVVENTDDIRSKIRDDVVPNLEKLITSANVNAKAQLSMEEDRLKEEEKKSDLQMFADRFAERTNALAKRQNAVLSTALGRVFGGFIEKILLLLPAAIALRVAPDAARLAGGLVVIDDSLDLISGLVRATFVAVKNLISSVLGFVKGKGFIGNAIIRLADGTFATVRFLRRFIGIGDRIAKAIFFVSGVVTNILRFFSGIGNFLGKLAPIVTLVGGVFNILKPIFSLLGKIFFPLTVILGVVQGLSDYAKSPGGLGKLLTLIFNGILESFTFGLLDIERLYGIFDFIMTSLNLLTTRIPFDGRGPEERERIRRAYEERKADRLASRAERENARQAAKTRQTIEDGFARDDSLDARENILSDLAKDITKALGLATGGDPQMAGLKDAVVGLGAVQAEAVAADATSKAAEAGLRSQQGNGGGSPTPTPPPVDPDPVYTGGYGSFLLPGTG